MVSAKEFTLLTNISVAKDTNKFLNIVTAYGIISGKIDTEMLDVMDNASNSFENDNQAEIEPITEFNVITLKNVTIRPSGNLQSTLTLNCLTVFPDQVIAVYVGEGIQAVP